MNVGVIGLGLIGGSIALKIKEIDINTVIYGLDKDMDSMSYSLSKGMIDKKLDINSIDNLKYIFIAIPVDCLLYTSPSPRDLSTSRMPSSA